MPMECSLNEIQTLSYKAARGAGLAWGVAQDAGWAVRWLEARHLPGSVALARSLTLLDGQDIEAFQPIIAAAHWQSRGGRLHGLLAGIALSDRCEVAFTLDNVAAPLLLLPFIATVAAARRVNIDMDVADDRPVSLSVTSDNVSTGAQVLAGLDEVRAVTLAMVAGEPLASACPLVDGGVTIDDDAWQILDGFAQRTYVPESDESRARGAGSGENDAD